MNDHWSDQYTKDQDEPDYAMTETRVKYVLLEAFEKACISDTIRHYNFAQILKNPCLKFDLVYSLDSGLRTLAEGGSDLFVYYGRCQLLSLGRGLDLAQPVKLSPLDLLKSKRVLLVMALNKQVRKRKGSRESSPESVLAELNQVHRPREIPVWMDFNYIYCFDLKELQNLAEPQDAVRPYWFKLDPTQFGEISLVSCDRLAVHIQTPPGALLLAFDRVLETNRFFDMSRKAKCNLEELVTAGNTHIVANLDFCVELQDSLTRLRRTFQALLEELYQRTKSENPGSVLSKLSDVFNSILVALQCDKRVKHKCVAIFLEQFQSFYFRLAKDGLREAVRGGPSGLIEKLRALANSCVLQQQAMKTWAVVDKRIVNFRKVGRRAC